MYRSGTAPLIKLRHCFIKHRPNGKDKIQETTQRNFCCHDNYKTRLSKTKYRALTVEINIRKKVSMTSFEATPLMRDMLTVLELRWPSGTKRLSLEL